MTKAPKGQTLKGGKTTAKRAPAARGPRPPAWLDEAQRDERGRIASTTDNARLALSLDPAWRGVFGFDLMVGLPMMMRAPKLTRIMHQRPEVPALAL
jgi:hypothetical protein